MVSSPFSRGMFSIIYIPVHGSERKSSRAKHHGKLKQKWSFFDDYLKIAYWYPRIPVKLVKLGLFSIVWI